MAESRMELLAWVSQLVDHPYTKVEQLGTGAAYCQIYDSIFRDVQLSQVRFDATTEYQFLGNFKILQRTFTKHRIERVIPVEALARCKMQDNLEFLQWTKRYWDQHYPGGDYSAIARERRGEIGALDDQPVKAAPPRAAASRPRRGGGTTPTTGPRVGARVGTGPTTAALQAENNTLKETVVGLERERDFYFAKLRDIELLIQQACEEDPELEKQEDGLIRQIQTILYSTEEGFEIPEGEQLDDQETF